LKTASIAFLCGVPLLRALSVTLAAAFPLVLLAGCSPSVTAPPDANPDAQVTPSQTVDISTLAPDEAGNSSTNEQAADVGAIQQLIQAGKFAQAAEQLRPLLAVEPTDPQCLFLMAQCSHGRGELAEAVQLLELIPSDHPEAGLPALGQSADWLMQAGQLAGAEAKFLQMLDVQAGLAPVHRRLAELLNSQGRRVEAAAQVRALIRLGDVTERELLSLTTLSVPFHDEQHDFVSPSPLHNLARAKVALVQDDVPRAQQWVEQLRQAYPASTAIAAFQGQVYTQMQSDAALRRWVQSLPSGIESEPEFWNAIGQWMLRSGQPEVAVRCLCEAVTRDPTDRVAYLRLAEALASCERPEAAQRVAERQELAQQAWQLALNVGLSRETRTADMRALVETLEKLQRPWEAVAWRFVLASETGRLEQVLPGLLEQRQRLAQQDGSSAPAKFLTCGIALEDWPRPDLQSLEADPLNASDLPQVASAAEPAAPLELVDVASQVGIDFTYHNNRDADDAHIRMYQTAGGGIAVLDFDLDGWCDLYFTEAGGPPNDATASGPNRLYRNHAGQRFFDVAVQTHTADRSYGQGVAVADLNQDGFPDLVVANIGQNILYINNGDGTFRGTPIAGSGTWTTSIVCGDVDGDHLPDMVEINYIDDPKAVTVACWGEGFDCTPRIFKPANDRLLTRNLDGQWLPKAPGEGLRKLPNYGFAGVLANFDNEAGNDLFIANDTTENHFWISHPGAAKGAWQVSNRSQLNGTAAGATGQEQGCMGIATGDFDRNGTLDFCVTNYWQQPANLFLQRSPGFFVDAAAQFGLTEPTRGTVAFGAQAADFDRDGWLDMAVLNGHVFDPAENGTPEVPFRFPAQCFRGSATGFRLEANETPGSYWSQPLLGRTLASLDWNRDGRPDLVANHLDAPVALLENRTSGGHWLRIDLVGVDSERDAIGAEIIVTQDDQTWHAWATGGDGYQCSNQSTIDIGLGSHPQVQTLQIRWPSGKQQTFQNVATNQTYTIIETSDQLFSQPSPPGP